MSGQIFVSYRRDDSPGTTGRLFDRLRQRFSRSRIFMDIDAIEPGEEFLKKIEQAVATTTCPPFLGLNRLIGDELA